jgi:ribosomal protein S3
LKQVFKLENPQIEIEEIIRIGLDPSIIAEMIANSLEKFGIARFKGIGHKAMADVMNAGALGVEILIGGKVPSTRAKTWRFYQGYLKKCGDIAVSQIKIAYASAQLKSGTLGIKVSIMTPDTVLPDRMHILGDEKGDVGRLEEVKDEKAKKEIEDKVKEITSKEAGSQTEGREVSEKQEAKLSKKPAKKKTESKPKIQKRQESINNNNPNTFAKENEEPRVTG